MILAMSIPVSIPDSSHMWSTSSVEIFPAVTVTIHHSLGLAAMGLCTSAVLGGKVAAPDRSCLTLTGDGGFGVNPICVNSAEKFKPALEKAMEANRAGSRSW